MFSAHRTDDIGRLYQLKRELMSLRRAVSPLEIPLQKLADRQIDVVPAAMRSYFRDVYDHASAVRDQVGHARRAADLDPAGVAGPHLPGRQRGHAQDLGVGRIIAVPTAIAGVYGMNFQFMPELEWRWGYPMVLVLIVVACVPLYRGFKRNGWL